MFTVSLSYMINMINLVNSLILTRGAWSSFWSLPSRQKQHLSRGFQSSGGGLGPRPISIVVVFGTGGVDTHLDSDVGPLLLLTSNNGVDVGLIGWWFPPPPPPTPPGGVSCNSSSFFTLKNPGAMWTLSEFSFVSCWSIFVISISFRLKINNFQVPWSLRSNLNKVL